MKLRGIILSTNRWVNFDHVKWIDFDSNLITMSDNTQILLSTKDVEQLYSYCVDLGLSIMPLREPLR